MAEWLKHSTASPKSGLEGGNSSQCILQRGCRAVGPGGPGLKGSASPGPRNGHHRVKSKLKITCM